MLVEVKLMDKDDPKVIAQCTTYMNAMQALEDFFMDRYRCTRKQTLKRALSCSIDPNLKVYIVKNATDFDDVCMMSIEIKE